MKHKLIYITALVIFLFCNAVYAQDAKQLYSMAVEAAKSGDLDYAFMHFHSLLTSYPHSQYREDALFATGEYYFLIGDYQSASGVFIQFISDYPGSKGKLFALEYLLKIAQRWGRESLVKNLEKEIVTSQQLIFLFKNYKEYRFKSPLGKKHKAVYYIDKVEFYVDGELFAKISY